MRRGEATCPHRRHSTGRVLQVTTGRTERGDTTTRPERHGPTTHGAAKGRSQGDKKLQPV